MEHRSLRRVKGWIGLAGTCLLIAVLVVPTLAQDGQPKIEIKKVAPYKPDGGTGIVGNISGTVSVIHADKCQCKVVLYAQTNMWYVQPYDTSADTDIDGKGNWTSQTHGGTTYAALLVKSSWKAPATLDKLPAVGGDVLARATKEGQH